MNVKIPESEQENVLSLFWVYLREIEEKNCGEGEFLNRRDVEGGYDILNRIGLTKSRPRWEKK